MGYLRSRMAYLQGLVEGFEIENQTREGRVLVELLDVLDEMVEAVEEVDEKIEALAQYVDEMDDDLTDMENDFYEVDQADEADEEIAVLSCPDCGQPLAAEAGNLAGRDSINVVCPACGGLCSTTAVDHQAEQPMQTSS